MSATRRPPIPGGLATGRPEVAGVPAVEEQRSYGSLSVPYVRPERLEGFVDVELLLETKDAAEPPYWMHSWPASTVLAERVSRDPRVARGTRVLEVACGLGLPSLVAAARGARVVAIDWKLEPLRFIVSSARLAGRQVAAVQMNWTRPALAGSFDVCLAADAAYDLTAERALGDLLLEQLAPGGLIWLADSVNTHRRSLANQLTAAGLIVQTSQVRGMEDGRPVWVRLIEARRGA